MSNPTLEQRAAAYSLLVAAKHTLGLSDAEFVEWLVGEAMEIVPELFTSSDGDDEDEGLTADAEGWAVN